jgi:alpha-1,2-mannosyltransferase
MSVAAALRDAGWLTGARARHWVRPFTLALFGYVGVAAVLITMASIGRKPPAFDFDAFWAAGRFVLAGHPAAAYDNAAIEIAERAATIMPPGYLAFYYPPPFLLLCAPLGLFGFATALLLFVAGETALVLACLRRIVPRDWGWLPLLAFPGFLMNALSGQNAALSAACFAGAAIWLEERPVLAGMCLGGLVCKPQLALCIPVWLLLARRFRCAFACGGTAAASCVLSWLVLGTASWRGFFAHSAEVGGNIAHVAIIWPKLQSVYGAVMLAGGGVRAAIFAQGLACLVAVAWLAGVSLKRRGALVEVAAAATASLFFTPYLLDYDLAILAVPLACLARLAQQVGWRPYEKIVLLALFLLPLAARASAMLAGITLGPAALLVLMALIWRRAMQPCPLAPVLVRCRAP